MASTVGCPTASPRVLAVDPNGSIFASVIDRDKEPSITKIGKDLSLVVGARGLGRAVLFDDKTYNFDPQPDNGVLVAGYNDVQAGDWEMIRIAAIVLLVRGAKTQHRRCICFVFSRFLGVVGCATSD